MRPRQLSCKLTNQVIATTDQEGTPTFGMPAFAGIVVNVRALSTVSNAFHFTPKKKLNDMISCSGTILSF